MNDSNRFSAADATLGYLYQARCALLWSLQRQKTESDFMVCVETLDDVVFETASGVATDLLQTKHHRTKSATLTDASVDLWKTLRVWFEGTANGDIPRTALLHLLSTSVAPEGSAAARLRSGSRDVSAARRQLDDAAQTSTNESNRKAYEVYGSLDPGTRTAILERVTVIDAELNIEDMETALRREVYWACSREFITPFLERLEGWWLHRVIRNLTTGFSARIGSTELEAKMADLREFFKHDSLPIDDDLLEAIFDERAIAVHAQSLFVAQVELAKAGKHRLLAAIRDFYRASEQRSRWLRSDLVAGLELTKYERRLIEEWELTFEQVRDELGADATEELMLAAARSVLTWAERAAIPIRINVTEPFVCRGSLHILADEGRVGWHLQFRERLATLLGMKEGTA